MRTFRITLLALMVTLGLHAQENLPELVKVNVPMSYTEGLLKVYPQATDIQWERLNDNYKVEFVDGQLEHTIHFNKQGEKVRIEAEMVKANIPVALSEAIQRDYKGYAIDSIRSIERNGVTTYDVILHKSDWVEEIALRYSADGTVLGMNKY